MAELGLLINILAKVDKALTEIDKIKTNMKKMGEEGTKQTDRATLSAKRMGASLAMVGMLAKKAFSSIVDASPSMQVAFIMMGVEADNAWRSIGENLAPVIEDILSPAVRSLSEYIQALDPEIQTWIGLTIGVTIAIGLLTLAVVALSFVSLPLVGAIVLLGAAIAFVILASKGYFDGMAEKSKGWTIAIQFAQVAAMAFMEILGAFWAIIKSVWFILVNFFKAIWEGFLTVGLGIYQFFKGIIDFFIEMWNAIVAFIKGDDAGFVNAIDGIITAIKNIAIGIANIVIGLVKFVVLAALGIVQGIAEALGLKTPKIDSWAETVQGWGIDTAFHEGGTVSGPRDVMAWLKPKERVRTETQESALQRELARGGGRSQQRMNVNIYITNPSFNERSDIDRMATIIERRLTQAQNQRVFS